MKYTENLTLSHDSFLAEFLSDCVILFKFHIWHHLKHIYFHCFGNSCRVVLYKLFKLLNFILIENFCWFYMHCVSLFPCSSKTFSFFSKDFLITKSKALPRFPWGVLWLITKKTSVASFEYIVSTYRVLHSFFEIRHLWTSCCT